MRLVYQVLIDTDNITDETEINLLGELLRDQFFVQVDSLGCYSTFTLHKDVSELQDIIINDEQYWRHCRKYIDSYPVDMYWTWDDISGTLVFVLDKYALYNSDCKLDDFWKRIPLDFWDDILNGDYNSFYTKLAYME